MRLDLSPQAEHAERRPTEEPTGKQAVEDIAVVIHNRLFDQRGRPRVQLESLPDDELWLDYRLTHEEPFFTALEHQYERELSSYLSRFTGNRTAAEDVFQDTFAQVYRKADTFEQGRKFRPWLYTIATNQAIDFGRKQKRHHMVSLDHRSVETGEDVDDAGTLAHLLTSREAAPDDHMQLEERKRWLCAELNRLVAEQRTAVELVVFQGKKYREAAEICHVPTGTIKSRLHNALLSLTGAAQRLSDKKSIS